MRIGTWNLAGRWSEEHRTLLLRQECDVWLLTEVSDRMELEDWQWSRGRPVMAPRRWWAAVCSRAPMRREKEPHPASAAAVVDGVYFCSSVLPWRGCGGDPWVGERHADKTQAALTTLTAAWPSEMPVVWGGDWNHALDGREYAGSKGGREAVAAVLEEHLLKAPTAKLPHRLPDCLSIDHVAVPSTWMASAECIDTTGLSDHDVYVVDATRD